MTCGLAKPDVHESQVHLCVVPVIVTFRDKVESTYAFLDQGYIHSFCANYLIQELAIEGTRKHLHFGTITGTADNYESISCYLIVSDLSNETAFPLSNVHSVVSIPLEPNNVSVDAEVCNLPHLKDIPLKSLPPHASVNLLIGADLPELHCIHSARKVPPHGTPCTIDTLLGWSLLGPSLCSSQETNCTVNFISQSFDHKVSDLVEKMCENEFESGTANFDFPSSKEDRIAYSLMQSTVCETDNHYHLPLLRKEGDIHQLPFNLKFAQRRLGSLKKKFERNELRTKYSEVMNSYLSKSYSRRVPQSELSISEQPTWYLPHHPITNVNKPGEVRVVYDCAAKYNGMSINDVLMKVPHLMTSSTGVLSRFRKDRIAMVADVEAMFYQIKVDPSHIDALRILWWENRDLSKEHITRQMLVHLFGAASSPSCANFSLRQTAAKFGDLYNHQQ